MTPNTIYNAAGAGTELSYKNKLSNRDNKMAKYHVTRALMTFHALKVIVDALS